MRIFGIRDRISAFARDVFESPALRARLEQLEVQLAGVTTAALGWSAGQEAKQGQYGWSAAYQDVLDLRRQFDALWGRYRPEAGFSRKTRVVSAIRCGFCGRVVWFTDDPGCRIVLLPGKEGEIIRVVSNADPDLMVRVRVFREPQGHLLVECAHECEAVRA